MDCELCSSELSAYLDGELSDGRVAQVSKHIQICPLCAGELESLRQTKLFVEAHVGELELRPEIWKSVHKQIAVLEPPEPSAGLFSFLFAAQWRTAAGMAAAVLLMAAGIWVYLQYRETQRDLQQYMSNYIQAREISEQDSQSSDLNSTVDSPASTILHVEYRDNPFVDSQSEDSSSNPFRTEDR